MLVECLHKVDQLTWKHNKNSFSVLSSHVPRRPSCDPSCDPETITLLPLQKGSEGHYHHLKHPGMAFQLITCCLHSQRMAQALVILVQASVMYFVTGAGALG